MTLSEIARVLQAQISKSVYVEKDDDGQIYVATPFAFGDGDQPVVALVPNRGGWMLSDLGSTMFRLGFQLTDDAMANPENQRQLDSALSMAGIIAHNDELTKPLQNDDYADALFDFVHALLKIDELGDFGVAAQNPVASQQSHHRKIDQRRTAIMPAALPDKTIKVFHYLRQRSSEEQPATYGEIAAATDIPFTPNVIPHLNRIRDEICRPRGLPWLSAIAVNSGTKLPGKRPDDSGYGIIPDDMVISDELFPTWWRGMVTLVFATDWTEVNP